MLILHSNSEQQTDEIGQQLADVLDSGISIALSGEMGSGKTRFVRAVCQGLGVDLTQVNSPTFVLLQLYTDGRLPVAHFDTYRLADPDEFLAIGAEEFLHSPDYVCLIEWADRVCEILPRDHLQLRFAQTSPHSRTLTFSPTGPRSTRLVEAFIRRRTVGP